MRSILATLLALLCPYLSSGQTAISSGGTTDFTIGESIIHTFGDAVTYQTAGFHQGYLTTTGTVELENKQFSYEVFPNPSSDRVRITGDTELLKHIAGFRVTTLLGSEVLSVSNSALEIDVSTLPRGLYQLSALRENRQILFTHSIIIH